MPTSSASDLESARFSFGENWSRFLHTLTPKMIERSKQAILEFTKHSSFEGISFLDVGSGSGLSSLAAQQLGASVHSFDYDDLSVACTHELKRRYFPSDNAWQIAQGSALDPSYIKSVGEFDIVYSWGVLHHTGDMWKALELAAIPVRPGGLLYIALYNDQGALSKIWWQIKRCYNKSNRLVRWCMVFMIATALEFISAILRLFTFKNPLPFAKWRKQREERGMSIWYDWVDWIGGFPFEVATPESVITFYTTRGFELKNLRTKRGWGCCEYLFSKK